MKAQPKPPHFVYVLRGKKSNKTCHYIGYTNNFDKRLKQHNGLLKGGARSTKGGTWKLLCSLSGFASYEEALAAEWRFKHPNGHRGRTQFKPKSLNVLLGLDRWSKKHEAAAEIYSLRCSEEVKTELDTTKFCKTTVEWF